MKRTKAQRMLAAACGPALGVLLAVPVGGLIAGAAGAATHHLLHGMHHADNRHHPISHPRTDECPGGHGWRDDCGEHDLVEWAGIHRC